jgi:hypothetical protein
MAKDRSKSMAEREILVIRTVESQYEIARKPSWPEVPSPYKTILGCLLG